MSDDFVEKPLVRGVYLRIDSYAQGVPFYTLRTFNNLDTFPVSRGTYRGENNDSSPMHDLIGLLEARSAPYEAFQHNITPLHEIIHASENHSERYKGERALNEVVSQAKQLFFKEQLPTISLVSRELRKRAEDMEREDGHPLHYSHTNFSTVYQAVVGLHQAVQNAESSFDMLVVGTAADRNDKYGETPWVRTPLDLTESYLRALTQNKRAAESLKKFQKDYLEQEKTDSEKSGHSITDKLSEHLKK